MEKQQVITDVLVEGDGTPGMLYREIAGFSILSEEYAPEPATSEAAN